MRDSTTKMIRSAAVKGEMKDQGQVSQGHRLGSFDPRSQSVGRHCPGWCAGDAAEGSGE